MATGTIKLFFKQKGFGYVTTDKGEDFFFHISQVADELMSLVITNHYHTEPITFDLEPSARKEGELQANNINIDFSKRKLGYLVLRNRDGEPMPFVQELESGKEYALSIRNMKTRPSHFINFEDREGDPVIFTPIESIHFAGDFELIDDRRFILRFAEFTRKGCSSSQGFTLALEELIRRFCDDESWDYIQNKTNEIPILRCYIDQTCKRIIEQDKLVIGRSSDGKEFAYFNTGLADQYQNEVFAYFIKNDDYQENQPWGFHIPKWHFLEFNTEESRYRRYFTSRTSAEIASYFEPGTQLVLDPEDLKTAIPNWDHLYDRKSRIDVPDIKTMPEIDFRDAIKDSVELAYKRIKRNYKTAIPQFYCHEIQFLVPLYSRKDRQHALAAMVVHKDESIYEISTILTLDQAYNNARLLAKPDREWLNP